MTRTSPVVAFGLYALGIKQDATPTCSDVQTFSKVNDLITGNVTTSPYITYEPDFWLLDGGYKIKPTSDAAVHVGLMSLSMSNASGVFSVAPVLTIIFANVQTTDGLTLRFAQYSNDYCNDVDVAYYNASNVLIRTDSYTPTSWQFSTAQAVTSFKKIIITFNGTNKPYRYLRLTGIDFGELVYLTNENIKQAILTQECDPLSTTLPIDTLELNIFSSDSSFSIINPSGSYEKIKENMPLDAYEQIGNETIYLGKFYLDAWQNLSNNEIKLNCVDALGALEKIPYLYGGLVSPNEIVVSATTAGVLIADMLERINIPYTIDTELESIEVMGWIPVCSYREALQMIAFSIGARVTCSRMGALQIYKTTIASELTDFSYSITSAQKGLDQSLTLAPLVTGVELTSHKYYYEETSLNRIVLFDGHLAIGSYTIQTNEPVVNIGNSPGTGTFSYVDAGVNFVKINVTVAGNISITGNKFTDTKRVIGVYDDTVDASARQNIVKIDCTLVNDNNVDALAQKVYDYYQMRYLQDVKLYASKISSGDSALVDTLYNSQIGGVVEKAVFDLSGGFTSKVTIRGAVI